MLLQSHSSMSSPSLASPWFISDKAYQSTASVHYLFAAVQNVRNNLSDTPAMLVMIDTTFTSVNVLQHTRGLDMLTCTFLVFMSSLFRCHCSPSTSQIFSVSTLSLFWLFRCFSIPSEPVLLPPSYVKDVPPYPFNISNGFHHQSFNLHVPRQ